MSDRAAASISSVVYHLPQKSTSCCRLANHETANAAGIKFEMDLLDDIRGSPTLFETYTLPPAQKERDTSDHEKRQEWWFYKEGDKQYAVFKSDGTLAVEDPLWEKVQPKYSGGKCTKLPFAIPFKGDGSLEVALDCSGARIPHGKYKLIGKCIGADTVLQFKSDEFPIDKDKDVHLEIKTFLDWNLFPNGRNMGAFRGDVMWFLLGSENKEEVPCMAGQHKATPVEFYIIGSAVPAYFGDLENTFGIPVYLLRILLSSSNADLLSLDEYRQRVLEWAFSLRGAGKVYNRYPGGGPRYFVELDPPRSFGIGDHLEQFPVEEGEGPDVRRKYYKDRNHRFLVDMYLLESLYTQNNTIDVTKRSRVQCTDQCVLVHVALNIGCMKAEDQAQVFKISIKSTTKSMDKPPRLAVECHLVGFDGQCNNPVFPDGTTEAKANLTDKLWITSGPDLESAGFRQHWCVVIGPVTLKAQAQVTQDDRDRSFIFDACATYRKEQDTFVAACGLSLTEYLRLLGSYKALSSAWAMVAEPDMDMFFDSPRYFHPWMSEDFPMDPNDPRKKTDHN